MRYRVLCTDYDDTLASEARVDARTLAALGRFRAASGFVVLVTGRELDDLLRVFPEHAICDRIVAENGALLYTPSEQKNHLLAEPPPPAFVAQLRARGVEPLHAGRVIVATRDPHEPTVREVIRELGLPLHIERNKGAVMVLPSHVDKGTGARAALEALGLSPHDGVGIGDAENDTALLSASGLGVAVANALPALKAKAAQVTQGARSEGVVELIDALLAT